jgi:hypothetical protein
VHGAQAIPGGRYAAVLRVGPGQLLHVHRVFDGADKVAAEHFDGRAFYFYNHTLVIDPV